MGADDDTLKRPAEEPAEAASPKRAATAEGEDAVTKSPAVMTAAEAFQAFSNGGSAVGQMLARQNEEARQKELPMAERSEWGKLTLREQELLKMGIQPPPRNFTAEDKRGWTNEEKAMFKGQSQMHGSDQANAFMRQYFKENVGKPRPPRKDLLQPHASGYAIYVFEATAKRVENDETPGKKMTKLIKAEWNAESEETQAKFVERCDSAKTVFEAKWEVYEDELEKWEEARDEAALVAASKESADAITT
jgi:hypothetical protein